MDPHHPDHPGFCLLHAARRLVTEEEEPAGCHHDPRHQDNDWIGALNQGGGSVPADYEWISNPKQAQDEVSCG